MNFVEQGLSAWSPGSSPQGLPAARARPRRTTARLIPVRDSVLAALLIGACLAILASDSCLAQEAPPAPSAWAGWEPERLLRPPHPDTPLDLPREAEGAFQTQLADLIAGAKWERVAAQLVSRASNRSLQQRVLDRVGATPVGVSPAAIAQLRRWPEALQAADRGVRDEITELLRAPRDLHAARIEAVNRYPFAREAAELTARLGDEALEAGRCEESAAWWRRAAGLAPTPAFAKRAQRRLLWLRARDSEAATITGRLGPRPTGGPPRLRWLRSLPGTRLGSPPTRALASDAEAIYALCQGSLLSLSREDGRVRWAQSLLDGDVRRLYVGAAGVLVTAAGKRLEARSTRTGASLWTADLELEEIRDVRSWASGWLVLGLRDGHWRCVGVDARGQKRWATLLWEADPPLLRPIQRGKPGEVIPAGPVRRVRGDGRLSVLADACAVTAAGRVALLGNFHGEIRWARQRLFGLGLGANGPVDVGVYLGAFELWATTAAGLFVRLDPLQGRSLPLPPVPIGPKGPVTGYLVSAEPPVWLWRDLAFGGLASVPEGAPVGPLWAGAVARGWLALPRGEGIELRRGAARASLPWPDQPGQVRALEGELIVVAPGGVALLGWGPAALAPTRPPTTPLETLSALGHPSWRIRRAARERVKPGALKALRAALPQAQLSAPARREVEFVLSALLKSLARRQRWQQIAPKASWEAVERAGADPSGASLRALADEIKPGPASAAALRAEVSALAGWGQRLAFLELYLRADPRLEGRLVALCRTAGANPGAKQAAANLLVRSAMRGGSRRGIRLLIARQSFPIARALYAHGDQKLWEEVAPPELKKLSLRQVGVPFGAGEAADLPALWEALRPVLKPR